jgi:hypothetical protein
LYEAELEELKVAAEAHLKDITPKRANMIVKIVLREEIIWLMSNFQFLISNQFQNQNVKN